MERDEKLAYDLENILIDWQLAIEDFMSDVRNITSVIDIGSVDERYLDTLNKHIDQIIDDTEELTREYF